MTVNILTKGDSDSKRIAIEARMAGYHAYYSGNTCAIEIPDTTKTEARKIGKKFGKVAYVFE